MQIGVGGLLAEALDRLHEPAKLAPGDPVERDRLDPRAQARGEMEPHEQLPVRLLVERFEQTTLRVVATARERREQAGGAGVIRLVEVLQLRLEMLEQDVEVADRACRLAESLQRLAQAPTPVRIDVGARRAEERAAAPRRHAVPADVVGGRAEPYARIVDEQRAPLRLEHLPEPRRAAVAADRRGGNELLAADDACNEAHDLGGQREAGVPGLPFLDPLPVRERETPDDSGLRRQPRDRHPELLQVAVDGVVGVHDQVLALGPQPVAGRRSAASRRRGAGAETPDHRPAALLIVDHEE